MMRDNWLVNYAQLEGIQRALTGMSRRTKFDSRMGESVNDLRESYADFQSEFEEFFPMLMKYVDEKIKGS
jgi:acyl carrier protein phosphodiesterase